MFLSSGPDLDYDDDNDDGGKGDAATNGKPKTPQQRSGEAMIKHILSEVNGVCYSFRWEGAEMAKDCQLTGLGLFF